MSESSQTFETVKERIDEIVDEVSHDDLSLDDALALYEEAIKLGLSACELSESDIFPETPEETAMSEAAPYGTLSNDAVDHTTAVLPEEQPESLPATPEVGDGPSVIETGIGSDERSYS